MKYAKKVYLPKGTIDLFMLLDGIWNRRISTAD